MSYAFVIGNGESRRIYNLHNLRGGKGTIYGCNAIYRDHPKLCDKIIAVNSEMYDELIEARGMGMIPTHIKIIGVEELPKWDYTLKSDTQDGGRYWAGGGWKEGKKLKTLDFSKTKGSGCSAVWQACVDDHKDIFIIGFDMIGGKQWTIRDGSMSRDQNNIYKDSRNYPTRKSMKAYLKYEWRWQLKQLAKRFKDKNFYYINRIEVNESNFILHSATTLLENFKYGTYGDLKKVMDGMPLTSIRWKRY